MVRTMGDEFQRAREWQMESNSEGEGLDEESNCSGHWGRGG